MNKKQVTASFLIIGNEILSGRTIDKNLNFVAENLTKLGIDLQESRIIRDDEDMIIKTVNELRSKYDYLFTSGGIGPTHDDITSLSIAKAFKVKLIRDKRAVKLLGDHYPKEKLNQARLKMADIPEGAKLLDNPVSSAPGFKVENVFVMAGVPRIMQAMFMASREHLKTGAIIKQKTINIEQVEGNVADELARLQENHKNVEIGSYPYIKDEKLGTAIVFRSIEIDDIDKAVNDLKNILESKSYQYQEL